MNLTLIEKKEFERVLNLNLNEDARCKVLANMTRINTLFMIKKAGSGHIGSSFSALDLLTYIHLNVLKESAEGKDIFFSSKGHDAPGLYSLLIGLGKLDFNLVHQLRRLDGLPGHPDVGTPHMPTNTGSLGMGISKAKGFLHAKNILKDCGRVFVLTGDGELQEGQFWESLISAANLNMSSLTVIVDHNKVQSDTFVEDVSDLGDIEAKFSSFGWNVKRINGHNFSDIREGFSFSEASNGPTIIIADTIKGRGVSFMEHTAMDGWRYLYHSGAPSDEDYLAGVSELLDTVNQDLNTSGFDVVSTTGVPLPEKTNSWAGAYDKIVGDYSRKLFEYASHNSKIIALDADLVLDTGLIPIKDNLPKQFIECGISEMDMVSQAGTLALSGLIPMVHSFACFLTTRANEHIYNNATEKSKIVYSGSLAGLLPGGPGHSHQSVRDIGILSSIPGLVLFQPANVFDVESSLKWAIEDNPESTYLRLTSIPVERHYEIPEQACFKPGVGYDILPELEAETCIIAYGPVMINEACKAATAVKQKSGKPTRVINLPWLNQIDTEWLKQVAKASCKIITIDDHYVQGGQGQLIASEMAKLDIESKPTIQNLGVTSIPACGTNQEVLDFHGLSSEKISELL